MSRFPIDVDPASVKLLLSIVDLGSISKAARRHGLTQPSASRRIRDLERRLGLQLLERGVGGARPTGDGTALVHHCRNLVDAGDELIEAAMAIRNSERPAVSIAVSPASVRHDLPVVCAAAVATEPDVQLDLSVVETIDAASGVRDGRFELAVVDGPSPPIGLSGHLLVERLMEVVVGVGHAWWSRPTPVGGEELLATPMWLPPRGTGSRDVVEEAMNLLGSPSTPRAAGVGNNDLRLAQAMLGQDPALVRSESIGDSSRPGRGQTNSDSLRVVATSVRIVQPVRLVWKGRQPGSAAAFALWHQLRSAMPDFS